MLIQLILLGGGVATYLHQHNKPKSKTTKLSSNFNGKKLLHDFKIAMLGDERQQQLILDPKMKSDFDEYKKESDRNLRLSAGATGLALLGAVFPMLAILSAGAVLYISRDIFKYLWRDFKKGHFLNVYLIYAIMTVGMLAGGHFVLAALSGILGALMMKIIKKAEESSQKQLLNVFDGHPTQVWIEKEGVEIQIYFEAINKEDIVIVNAGEVIPVDGVIESGLATIDQHILTGESQSVEREAGDEVFASTLLLSGRITISVKMAGKDTLAAGIGNVLHNTQNYKDNLMARGQKVADGFLPFEIGLGVVTTATLGSTACLAALWSGLGANMVVLGPLKKN